MPRKPVVNRSELAAALWAFRQHFGAVGIFSLVINLLMLVPTIYMLQVYDRYMVGHNELTLVAVSIVTLYLLTVLLLAEWARSRLLVRIGLQLDGGLSRRIFDAAFDASQGSLLTNSTQPVTDLTNLRQFLTGGGVFALFDSPWTLVYLGVITLLHPWLGVASVIFAINLSLLAWYSSRVSNGPNSATLGAYAASADFLHAKLRHAEAVRAMGMTTGLRRRWLVLHDRFLALETVSKDANHRLQAVSKFVRYSQQSLMLAIGAWLVVRGEIAPSAMIAANVLMGRCLQPIDSMVAAWPSWLSVRNAFERLERLLETHPARTGGGAFGDGKGEVRIDRLVALAAHRREPILQGLSATFRAGSLTVIMGASGSGKSTLTRCLVGVWPEMQGSVHIDEAPVADLDRMLAGPDIGFLPQEIELLDGTIAENIARFGPIDSAKVIEAATRVGIHDMILRLPQGYDTPVGAAGRVVSGGQRQRIGLARAFYGNPRVIVLDEPNANLDDQGDAMLAQSLQEMRRLGRTILMVTHRRNILAIADAVMILNNGRIEAFGTPREVMAERQVTGRRPSEFQGVSG